MKGPVRLPAPSKIIPAINRTASQSTIRANCLVGYGTPVNAGETPLESLDVTGVTEIAGVIQHAVNFSDTDDLFRDGDVVLESDGTAVINAGDRVIAVAGASLAVSGRVKSLPGSPTPGTNYEVVGRAMTSATAVAGAPVVVRLEFETYQG